MRTRTIKLSDAARAVLARSTITADSVTLPGQLDRALYVEIDKVFKSAGGKWNRSRGAHVFTTDPREVLGLAAEKGEIVDIKQTLQFFETPPAIVVKLIDLVYVRVLDTVLEPSAGRGAIARRCLDIAMRTDVVEIHPPFCQELQTHGYRNVVQGDFLAMKPKPVYTRVVMNPPFSNGLDVDHVLHAWEFLAKGGRLAAITSIAWEFRDGQKWHDFRNLFDAKGVHVEWLPAGTFEDTDVRTKIVVLEK